MINAYTGKGQAMKALGYIRVSTQGQVEDGCSLILQQEKIEQYCRLNDLNLVSIITDAGKSGTTMAREGIHEVRQMVQDGTVSHLVIYKLDRLSRNLRGAIELSEFLEKQGCQLHSVQERIDTSSPAGRLFFSLMGAMAQFETEQLRQRTKQALQGLKERGQVYCNIPYGYQRGDDGKSLIVSQEEQRIIRRIRRYQKAGCSFNEIAGRLNTLGYTTKKGKTWSHKQVARILQA